jgi:hypothetical protein
LEDSTNVKYSSNVLQSRQDNLLQRAGLPDICELADSPSQRYHMLCWGPVPLAPARNQEPSSDVMENKDKSKQKEHDSGMFQVKEIPKTNENDGINLVLPISINGRKIDGIVDTGAQIEVVSEDCYKNLKLPVGCARFFPL